MSDRLLILPQRNGYRPHCSWWYLGWSKQRSKLPAKYHRPSNIIPIFLFNPCPGNGILWRVSTARGKLPLLHLNTRNFWTDMFSYFLHMLRTTVIPPQESTTRINSRDLQFNDICHRRNSNYCKKTIWRACRVLNITIATHRPLHVDLLTVHSACVSLIWWYHTIVLALTIGGKRLMFSGLPSVR